MMNFAVAINDGFLRYAYVMITSLLENHKGREVTVYVLHRGIDREKLFVFEKLAKQYDQTIHCLEIREDMFPGELPCSEKWPVEIYFRLALPYLLPKEERILYLDADVIVNQSLSELYETELEGHLLAACPDVSDGSLSDLQKELFRDYLDEEGFHYYNSGVLLMDLEGIRREFSFEYLIDQAFLLQEKLSAFDQDLINFVFRSRILELEAARYNHFARIGFLRGIGYEEILERRIAIIHYSGPKPWSAVNLRTNVEKLWWVYAKMTPYYREMMEELLYAEMEKGYQSTNEFRYQTILYEESEREKEHLKAREKELLEVMEQSRRLIEKLSEGNS